MNLPVPAGQPLGHAPVLNIKVLNYQNDHVVERLVRDEGMTLENANQLQVDTLRFLSLAGSGTKLSPPARIDLGWHNFILHTRDYAEFCASCFGYFLHHEPGSGLVGAGNRLSVEETVELARSHFGDLSANWNNVRGQTCGSNGC